MPQESMLEFVHRTFGAELQRACTFAGVPDDMHTEVMADLDAFHEAIGVVGAEIRWWKDGELKQMSRYSFHHKLPGESDGDPDEYVPEGELPPTDGYGLQVGIITAEPETGTRVSPPDEAFKTCGYNDGQGGSGQ